MAWLPHKRACFEEPPRAEEDSPRLGRARLRVFTPKNGGVIRTSDRVTFRQGGRTVSPAVMSGLPGLLPANFARAITGDVYFANGLTPVMKWDGVRFTAQAVGVAPPAAAPVLAATGAGAISGTYTAYQRFLDELGNPSNLSPVSNELVVQNRKTFAYSAVEAPADPKIVRRQLLRNTTGQAVTYYVDVDTTDLSATAFTSTRDDEALQTQEAVPLFDAGGNSLADRFGVPPSHKPVLAAYLDRMFAAGDVVYDEGHAEVANGSASVTGVGTRWTAALAGRFFYPVGGGASYQVASVDAAAQALTLAAPYAGATDPFCVYVIQPPPAERNLVYFSEAGLPEAWPVTNALAVEEAGDDVTALMSADSFLYLFQRQRSYRLSYHQGPALDGAVFPAARRGCVNQRCWVNVDGSGYLLDQLGVYKFEGGSTEGLSAAIQDLFMIGRDGGGLRVNWSASRWFHASHSPDERSVRWFVALSGDRLPRHAICWNYDSRFWWVEEYAFPVGSSALLDTPPARPLVSGPARRVFAQGFGSLDGPDPAAGTTRAQASAGLADGLAGPAGVSYPAAGVAGSPVAVYDGRGKGQVNVVASAAADGTVRCVRPWAVRPDATSKFQLGGFAWTWQSGLYRWLNEEGDEQRRVVVVYPPAAAPAQCDLRFYAQFSESPDPYGFDWPAAPAGADSLRVTAGSADAVIDLTYQYGFAQLRRPGRRERYVQNADVFSLELAGVSAEGPVAVYEINLEGAE